jgi:hypothetical protein
MELANSIVTLQPGMYILRHPKTGMPPLSISRAAGAPGHNGSIQALYTPGTDGSVLRDGKDCIVMQVLSAPVDLLVTAYLEKIGVAVPSLKIDKIALDRDAAASSGKPMEVPPKGISIIGHIERTGDVVATPGQTLGDLASNLRVEGFQVMWPDKPKGVELMYSGRVEGAPAAPLMPIGKFCGTRNSAKRLVEVTFTLTGDRASSYELKGVASFSGGFSAEIRSGLSIQGPSGLEHLTALQLSAEESRTKKQVQGAWEPSPRTKIFRAPRTSTQNKR